VVRYIWVRGLFVCLPLRKCSHYQVHLRGSARTYRHYRQLFSNCPAFLHNRQLSAVKSQVASVDHLKEIERLRGLLSAAEANARTLTAQLNSKEFGE
jgi:hypothetical protein